MTGPAVVHIGLCPVKPAATALATLCSDERQTLAGLRRRSTRDRFIASRWLLRSLLGEVLQVPARTIPLVWIPGQAPALPSGDWRLGISHGGDLCMAIACHGRRVGCDVETIDPRRPLAGIARSYFHPMEAATLEQLPGDTGDRHFARLWTLKEAGKKARGQSIWSGLHSPHFGLHEAWPILEDPEYSGRWQFVGDDIELAGRSHACALAVEAGRLDLSCHWYGEPPGISPDFRPIPLADASRGPW